MNKHFFRLLIILLLTISGTLSFADEGMYPVSELNKLNLQAKGLKLTTEEIYNPDELKDGFNTLKNGEEIYYISNPAVSLWAYKGNFKN